MKRTIVRRLIPEECELLQGFPMGYTNIPVVEIEKETERKDKKTGLIKKLIKKTKIAPTDSNRYKVLGNSICIPQWYKIMKNMEPYLEGEEATLGSLFDGIGGFPLAWEDIHGKGSAIWAAEIEPFPIAVTKYHFGDE